jgi:hypothetical protein
VVSDGVNGRNDNNIGENTTDREEAKYQLNCATNYIKQSIIVASNAICIYTRDKVNECQKTSQKVKVDHDRLAFGGHMNHLQHRKSWLVCALLVVLACLLQPCLGVVTEWRIESGEEYCQVDSTCVTNGRFTTGLDSDWREKDKECTFRLTGSATLIRATAWILEEFDKKGCTGGGMECCDYLMISGTTYCDNYNPFPKTFVCKKATAFRFAPNKKNNRRGFRICISSCPAGQFFTIKKGCKECAAGKWSATRGEWALKVQQVYTVV